MFLNGTVINLFITLIYIINVISNNFNHVNVCVLTVQPFALFVPHLFLFVISAALKMRAHPQHVSRDKYNLI